MSRISFVDRLWRVTLALSLTAGGMLVAMPAAHAATAIICTGQQTNTYKPPVSDTPQTVKVTSDVRHGDAFLHLCVSTVPGLTHGTAVSAASLPNFSCTALRTILSTEPSPVTIHWNTGQFSKVMEQTVQNVRGLGTTEFTVTGTVTHGLGAGTGAYLKQVTVLNTDLDACSTTGLGQVTGETQLSIITL